MSKVALTELLRGFGTEPSVIPQITISGLTLDSREVTEGDVFIALQGTKQHGLAYALRAEQAGAAVILHDGLGEVPADLTIPVLAIPDLAQQLGFIAQRFYQLVVTTPAIDVIGVTGTDGKTSVTHFIAEALNSLNQSAAVLGTLGIGQPGQLKTATHTTPDAIHVQQHLHDLAEAGFQTVAMEVSSHALDQGRVNAVPFATAVLTNLTRDHLDYHGTVEAYASAKRQLFFWPNLGHAVLNLDDAFGRQLAADLAGSATRLIGYGIGNVLDYPHGSLVATETRFDQNGIWAAINTPEGEGILQAPVLGRFNVYNLLAALGALLAHSISLPDALKALNQVYTVPGRMQRVSGPAATNELLVVVDYAHTPGALTQVLQAARLHTRQRLICVFGCGGDRDAGKRPLMAAAAEQGADVVIVTDDNPRTESAQRIFDDIRAGFARPEAVVFEHDRTRAIQRAIHKAKAGDTVVIAGKGHETVQILAERTVAFDDRVQAALALEEWRA